MTWTARLTLIFLFFLGTLSAIAHGAADHPWKDSATAEAFMGCLVDSLAKSGYMTPDDMDTIQMLAATMESGAERKEKSGGDNPKKLEALNMGLGAGLAEIVSSKGKGDVVGATAAVKNAMIDSFMQTTGSVNHKFINEVVELIQMFSEDRDLPNYSGESVTVSENGPSSFGSGPQKLAWSETEASAPAEFSQGQNIVGPQGSFASKESSTSVKPFSGLYDATDDRNGQGGYGGANSMYEAGVGQGGGGSAEEEGSYGHLDYDYGQSGDGTAAIDTELNREEAENDRKGHEFGLGEGVLAIGVVAAENGGEGGYDSRDYAPGQGNEESAADAVSENGGEIDYHPVQEEERSAAVNAVLNGEETRYRRGYESELGAGGSANSAITAGSGGEGDYEYGGNDYGQEGDESAAVDAALSGVEAGYVGRDYESGIGKSELANNAAMAGNGEGDYGGGDYRSGVGADISTNAASATGSGGEDYNPGDFGLGEGENIPAIMAGIEKEEYYNRRSYGLGRRGYRLAAATIRRKEEGINFRRGYVLRRGRYRIATAAENRAGGSYISGGYGPEWREGGSIAGAVE